MQESQLLNGKFRIKIVAYSVSGLKEYGALLIPKANHPLPVRMLVGGFGFGITENSVTMEVGSSLTHSPFILAIPALRGQSLAITGNGIKFTSPVSEGDHCDAFDGATEIPLPFLYLIQLIESQADVNRTSVRGGSRGGTVALLAGIRDKRIKRVVGIVSPTDFVALTAKNENDPTYQCQFLKGAPHTPTTLQEARAKLLASSPLYYADQLPLTQLHMGLNGRNVPIAQGTELEKKIIALGKSSTFTLYTYPRTHTDITSNNPELRSSRKAFRSKIEDRTFICWFFLPLSNLIWG